MDYERRASSDLSFEDLFESYLVGAAEAFNKESQSPPGYRVVSGRKPGTCRINVNLNPDGDYFGGYLMFTLTDEHIRCQVFRVPQGSPKAIEVTDYYSSFRMTAKEFGIALARKVQSASFGY